MLPILLGVFMTFLLFKISFSVKHADIHSWKKVVSKDWFALKFSKKLKGVMADRIGGQLLTLLEVDGGCERGRYIILSNCICFWKFS